MVGKRIVVAMLCAALSAVGFCAESQPDTDAVSARYVRGADRLYVVGSGLRRGRVLDCRDDNVVVFEFGPKTKQDFGLSSVERLELSEPAPELVVRLVRAAVRVDKGLVAFDLAAEHRALDPRLATLANYPGLANAANAYRQLADRKAECEQRRDKTAVIAAQHHRNYEQLERGGGGRFRGRRLSPAERRRSETWRAACTAAAVEAETATKELKALQPQVVATWNAFKDILAKAAPAAGLD